MGRRSRLPAFVKICEKFEGSERCGRTCHSTAASASEGCAAIERSIGVLAKFQIVDTVNLHLKGPGRNDNLFLKDYNLSSIMIFFSYSSIGYK